MTKLRVHELAKELGKENKEIIDFLRSEKIEVKSHMSSISDEHVALVKAKFSAKASAPAETQVTPEAPAAPAEPPKKKNIVQVFRPQNSQSGRQGNRGGFQRRDGQGQRPMGGRPAYGQGQRPVGAAAGQRPVGTPMGQRPERPAGAPMGQRPERSASALVGQKPQRPTGTPVMQRPVSTPVQEKAEPKVEPKIETKTETKAELKVETKVEPKVEPKVERPVNTQVQSKSERPERQRPNNNFQGQRRQDEYPRREDRQGDRRDDRRNDRRDDRGDNRRDDRRNDRRDDRRDVRRDDRREDRRDDRRNGRRNERDSISIPAPIVPEQKVGRKQNKDNYKKKDKDYRIDDQEERGPKNKKNVKNVPLQAKPQQKAPEKVEEKIKTITIPEVLTIKELAEHMKVQPSVIVKKLFLQGKIVTVNQEIDYDTAEEIALEFEVLCEKEEVVDVIEELLKEEEEDEKKMKKRPPVVCVMGHVDHGKTSLLDAIRNTSVTSGEAGGITQHIGAYVANVNGEKITFLDTPGHEAFTAMRMRGANSTDIAILVVAADDGVMPQTIEAISHAKAAGIEIIVAVNKIDKPSANIERVKQELTEYELIAEDWGGSTVFVPVSAKTGEGIEELMEMILLTAEVLELKANANRRARGLVIEAELDKGKGPVATILVQKGTLRVGDAIAAGSAHGKVRAMMDDKGRRVKEAGPSTPVEILGLDSVPNAGEVFVGCGNEKEARSFAETFISQNKVKLLDETKSKMSLDDLFTQIQAGNLKELNIIVKADVQGSVEAIKQSLVKLSNDEVIVKIIHGGVGAINESDVTLASASNAIIIGFNVRPDAAAKDTAERENVDVRLYRVIYNAIEDVEAAMKGMLDPVFEEKVLGHAEVRQTFKASGVGTIAGSYVLDGIFERGCSARIIRDGVVIHEGDLASLKRFKDDVKEVKAGYECGFVFEKFNDIKEGDQVEAFKMVEVPR